MNCSKCGAQNIDGVTFCGNCGAKMESIPPQIPEPTQNQQQSYDARQMGSGSGNESNAYTAPAGPSNGGMVPPKNYMVEAVIVTIVSFVCCCCSPISIILGIIAIVKANSVNSEYERGNISEAFSSADTAKKLTIWAAIISVIFALIIMVLYFIFFAAVVAEAGGWDALINK